MYWIIHFNLIVYLLNKTNFPALISVDLQYILLEYSFLCPSGSLPGIQTLLEESLSLSLVGAR